jgi:hypothetical protein
MMSINTKPFAPGRWSALANQRVSTAGFPDGADEIMELR